MLPSTTVSKLDMLLARLAKLIASQTKGEPTGFSVENLNQAYLGLAKGQVSEDTAFLLDKMLGSDWLEGLELKHQDQSDDDTSEELAEVIEQIDITDPQDAVGTLAYALMIACRELGWLETSRAAHDQWFYSASVAYQCKEAA